MKFSRCIFIYIFLCSAVSIFAQSETEKGVELYRNGDFDGAITILQKVVETDKNDREAWTYLGASFVKKGNKKDALKAFQKADSISTKIISEGLKIISKPRPAYTDLAREKQLQGNVRLAVEFGENGEIKFVFPVKSLEYGLTESCVAVAKKIKFETAKKDGQPITSVKIIEYFFTLY